MAFLVSLITRVVAAVGASPLLQALIRYAAVALLFFFLGMSGCHAWTTRHHIFPCMNHAAAGQCCPECHCGGK